MIVINFPIRQNRFYHFTFSSSPIFQFLPKNLLLLRNRASHSNLRLEFLSTLVKSHIAKLIKFVLRESRIRIAIFLDAIVTHLNI